MTAHLNSSSSLCSSAGKCSRPSKLGDTHKTLNIAYTPACVVCAAALGNHARCGASASAPTSAMLTTQDLLLQALQGGATTLEEALDHYFTLPDSPDEAEEDGCSQPDECGDDLAYAGSQPHDRLCDVDMPFEVPLAASQSSAPASNIYSTGAAASAAVTNRASSTLPPRSSASAVLGKSEAAAAPGKGKTASVSGATGQAKASGNVTSRQRSNIQELPSIPHQALQGQSLGRLGSQESGLSGLAGPLGSQVSMTCCCSYCRHTVPLILQI